MRVVLAGGFTIISCVLPALSATQTAAEKRSSDEASLRSLAERFFAACQNQDQKGSTGLWSDLSTDLSASKKNVEQDFPAARIDLKSFEIRKVAVEGETALVRVVINRSARSTQGTGAINRTLRCIKTDEWKISAYLSSEADLAAAVATTDDDERRKTLIAADKDIVNIEFERALRSQGKRFGVLGDYSKAMSLCQFALTIAQELQDKDGIATALGTIGNIHWFQGRYDLALETHQKSLKIREEIGDKFGISGSLIDIGNINYSRGDFAEAIDYYQRSLRVAEEIGDKVDISAALNNMGSAYRVQGDYVRAVECLGRSLKLAEESGDETEIARPLITLGSVYLAQGSFTQALEHFQRSLKIAERTGNKTLVSRSLNNIGLVYQSQGNYIQALACFQRSLKIKEELGDKSGIGAALGNIGLTHSSEGNIATAIDYYNRGLKIAEELGDKAEIASYLENLAASSESLGDYEKALEYYRRSLKIRGEIGDKHGVASALSGIGSVLAHQKNYHEALEYDLRSLKIFEELADRGNLSGSLNQTASIHVEFGNYTQALELATRSSNLAKQIGAAETFWEALTIAARANRALGNRTSARQALAEAIATIEDLREKVAGGEQLRQKAFSSRVNPYYYMIDLLIAEGDSAQALAYAERCKARVLLDVLQSGKLEIGKSLSSTERNEERLLIAAIVSLNTRLQRAKASPQPNATQLADLDAGLQKARRDYEAFETILFAAHPETKIQRGQTEPLTLKESGAVVSDARTAILEFVVMEDKTHVFVLNRHSPGTEAPPSLKTYTVNVKEKELADRVERFRSTLADRRVAFQQQARELYDLLLRPAGTLLKGKARLIIIPDRVLWQLPFQALQPSPDRFLIEQFAVSYAPSLTVLNEMTKLKRKRLRAAGPSTVLLAFGNPDVGQATRQRVESALMDEKLVPLPEAERQVKMIGQIYGPAASEIYLGAEAREARLKQRAATCRILHLATHGIANDASPMYSHLVLSQAQDDHNEDGLLEAWEIMNLDLHADLAVLSACDTARGQVVSGEGVIGLAWAFFVAGCPTTVVSQWKVDSSSTTDLMIEFHRRLRAGSARATRRDMSEAEALRAAALTLMKSKSYQHPFYWAAFVVVGGSN
jgi:CHAT domain-containing protein/tetratricopeptide (TPR) repeat protein